MGFQQEYPAGVFTAVTRDAPFVVDHRNGETVRWPTQVLDVWSDEQLAAIGITRTDDPVPVPVIISDRQFFQALALMQVITQQEALDAVKTGTIPAQMMIYVNAIADPTERFSATMLLSGAIEFRRDHPLSSALMNANGWTEQQADDLWRFAASL